MFGFKRKVSPPVFDALHRVVMEVASTEQARVVEHSAQHDISLDTSQEQELLLECIAFHCATLFRVAFNSLSQREAEFVTAGTVQEISCNLDKYLGAVCDQVALQDKILSRAVVLAAYPEFAPPEFTPERPFENFEASVMGQHALAIMRLLNLGKYRPETLLIIMASRSGVLAALKTDLYKKALDHSMPMIRLSQAFPGNIKG